MHSYFSKDYANECFGASTVDSDLGQSNRYTAQAQVACLAEILLMFKEEHCLPRGYRIRLKLAGNNFNSVKVTADKISIILHDVWQLVLQDIPRNVTLNLYTHITVI